MEPGQELYKNGRLLAKVISGEDFFAPATLVRQEYEEDIRRVDRPWDIVQHNDAALRDDFALLTKGRKSAPVSKTNQVVNPAQIFLEPGAKVECSVLNAASGPIYVGKDAEIMEGNLIRGPLQWVKARY